MSDTQALTPYEQDKLKYGFDQDLRTIADRTFESFTANELAMLKWAGVHKQLQPGFFMLRLKIPGGLMTSRQLSRAAALAAKHGRNQLCITTRQCLQYHWVRLADLHKIVEGMQEVGISTRNAGGDTTRNVVVCPLAGVCPHEKGETLKVLQAIADDPVLLDEQRNLPRKQKISVAGCDRACGQTLMNCQGWHAVQRNGETGWAFCAGGGLGARPILAKSIFSWVPEDMVVPVTRAVTEIFRRLGDRQSRAQARLKFVVEKLGASAFAEEVLRELRDRKQAGIDRIVRADQPAGMGEDFLRGQPVIPQRQKGLNAVRVIIRRSEMSWEEAIRLAKRAGDYGDGTIMFTSRQNVTFRGVPDENVDALRGELVGAGYMTEGFEQVPDMVACVGTTVCNLAVADTPAVYRQLMEELTKDAAWWRSIGPVRINMNGCPNSCGQHAVSDIGLRGIRKRTEQGAEEGYGIFVGGSLAGFGRIAEPVCDVTAQEAVSVVKRILDIYLARRISSEETFGVFSRRVTGDGIRQSLIAV